MKKWLDRVLGRDDWIAQAMRLGMNEFSREWERPEKKKRAPNPDLRPERISAQIELFPSIP